MRLSTSLSKTASSVTGSSTRSALAGSSLNIKSALKSTKTSTSTSPSTSFPPARRSVPVASSSSSNTTKPLISRLISPKASHTKRSVRDEILEMPKKPDPIRQTKSFQGEKSFWQSYKDIGPLNQVYVGIAFMLFGGFIWWTDKLVPEEEEKLDTVIERRRGIRLPERDTTL